MPLSPPPSTGWQEQIDPDEAERHERFAGQIGKLQTKLNGKYGPGRAFHRPQIAGVTGELVVTADEPELRQGLFATDGPLTTLVRMSHGAVAPHADPMPDIQGFAMSVRGISGPGALADQTDRQDFLLINMPAFGFSSSAEFADIVGPSSRGQVALAKHLISSKGIVAGPLELARLTKNIARPFSGFATTTFHLGAPIAYGPYAAKIRVVPVGASLNLGAIRDHHKDVADRLRRAPLHYDVEVQFFLDEQTTPIEDMRDPWPQDRSPYHPVARLTIPQQDIDSRPGQQLADQIEHDRFDPWSALADHRPLGEVMRARKAAYYPSVVNRGADD